MPSTKANIISHSQEVPYNEWLTQNVGQLSEDKQDALLRAKTHAETLKHRGWWSRALIGVVLAINLVNLFVVIGVGFHWLSYNGGYAVPAIIGANFAETWTLTKIAMKFYFNSTDASSD